MLLAKASVISQSIIGQLNDGWPTQRDLDKQPWWLADQRWLKNLLSGYVPVQRWWNYWIISPMS